MTALTYQALNSDQILLRTIDGTMLGKTILSIVHLSFPFYVTTPKMKKLCANRFIELFLKTQQNNVLFSFPQ